MIEKNQELEVEIIDYGSEGQGIAKIDGFVIFVPFALKGEIVKIHIIKVAKNFAIGKIIQIIKKSSQRVLPKCGVYSKCGGCQLEHSSYENSLLIKQEKVYNAIKKIAGLDFNINKTIPSSVEYGYRNKAAFPIVYKNEKVEICMYKNLSHDEIVINDCKISDLVINIVAKTFCNFVNINYSFSLKKALRFLVIRAIENKVLITIVSKKPIEKASQLFDEFKKQLNYSKEQIGLSQIIKQTDNNVILEGEFAHLLGINKIVFDCLNVNIEVSPLSFFQVNIPVMKKLYESVLGFVEKDNNVIDAYSGAGLLSCLIAKKTKKVIGIEIVKEAISDAILTAKKNNINNIEFLCGDVKDILPTVVKENEDYTLVLDPPRKGIDEDVVKTILISKPKKIIYVSCDPATLARDLKLLSQDYYLNKVIPFDMFPQTCHVETLAILLKKD